MNAIKLNFAKFLILAISPDSQCSSRRGCGEAFRFKYTLLHRIQKFDYYLSNEIHSEQIVDVGPIKQRQIHTDEGSCWC